MRGKLPSKRQEAAKDGPGWSISVRRSPKAFLLTYRNASAPAAADEESALTATPFSVHVTAYQAVDAPAMVVHELSTATLHASAGSYAAIETANSIAAT